MVSSCPVSLNWFCSHHRDDSQRELAADAQWCKAHSSSVVGSCIRTRLKKMEWCGSEGSLHSRKLLLHRVLIPSVLLFCLPSKLVARCPIIPLLTLPLICSTNDSNPLNGVQKQHLPITAPYPNLGFLL